MWEAAEPKSLNLRQLFRKNFENISLSMTGIHLFKNNTTSEATGLVVSPVRSMDYRRFACDLPQLCRDRKFLSQCRYYRWYTGKPRSWSHHCNLYFHIFQLNSLQGSVHWETPAFLFSASPVLPRLPRHWKPSRHHRNPTRDSHKGAQ